MILQKRKYQILLFLSLIWLLSAQQVNKCCLTYDKTSMFCLSCPDPAYIYGNNCILNIDNCKKYSDCFSCAQCESGFKLSDFQIKGIKTKKCQSTVTYTKIDPQKLEGRSGQAFNITNEFMGAYHLKQLKNGKPRSGFLSKYENGSQIMQIQYQVTQGENQQSKFYRGIMLLDAKAFNFTELQFKQIKKSQLNLNINKQNLIINKVLPINTGGIIGVQSKYQQYSQNELNLNANQNQNLIKEVNETAQGLKSIYNRIIKILIRTYKNNSQNIQVSYQRIDNAIQKVNVDPKNRRVLSVIEPQTKLSLVKAETNLSLNVNITKPMENSTKKSLEVMNKSNLTTIWPKTDVKGYQQQNVINLLKSLDFLVIFDILRKKYKGYTNILPKEAYIKIEADTQYFLLYFQKPDRDKVQVFAKIKQKIKGEIIHQHVIEKLQKAVLSRNYTPQQVSQISKSIYFIPSAVQMKKLSQKYVVDNIKYVAANQDQPNNAYFQVVFCNDGVITQLQMQTKKKLRTSQVLGERILKSFNGIACKTDAELEKQRITAEQNKNKNFSFQIANITSTFVQVSNTTINQKQLISNSTALLAPSTSNSTPQLIKSDIPSNNVTIIIQNPKVNNNSTESGVKENKTLSNITQSNNNLSNQTSLTQKTDKSIIIINPKQKISLPSQLPKNLSSAQMGNTKMAINSSTQGSKNQKQLNSLGNTIQKCLPTDLPPQILTQITGFNQIINQDARIKKILDFIQKNQAPRLDKSCIIAYFYKIVGLTTQYKIYFSIPNFGILQVFLVYDTLKSRMYILNITPIILSANRSN